MAQDNFFEQVYEIVRLIPAGRVTSYGAIASYLGTKGSSRMVGYAMKASDSVRPAVPAHRVVNRQGLLTGKFHFPAAGLMQQMLESEGVEVKDNQVQNFQQLYWDPAAELK